MTLPSAWQGAGLLPGLAPARLPAVLQYATARAATGFAAGPSGGAMALAQAVLRSMAARELGLIALSFLALSCLAIGAAALHHPAQDSARERLAPIVAVAKGVGPAVNAGLTTIAGRVLDPAGNPMAGAKLVVLAQGQGAGPDGFKRRDPAPIGTAGTDPLGRYQLQVPRTASSRHEEVAVLAGRPGFGVGWTGLDPDVRRPVADVRLRPERIIHGRLIDLHGRPIEGVAVAVTSMSPVAGPASQGPLADWLDPREMPLWPAPRSLTPRADAPSAASGTDSRSCCPSTTSDSPGNTIRSIPTTHRKRSESWP